MCKSFHVRFMFVVPYVGYRLSPYYFDAPPCLTAAYFQHIRAGYWQVQACGVIVVGVVFLRLKQRTIGCVKAQHERGILCQFHTYVYVTVACGVG